MNAFASTAISDEARPVIAKSVVVACVSVTLPLKALAPEKVLLVVVPKPIEKTPVLPLYESGYVAESDVELTLALNAVQSDEARNSACEPDA